MKTTFLFISFLFITFLSNAEFYSHCTIYTESGEKFTVYLNGEKKNEEPSERVRIINLTQSYYSLKIIFEGGEIPNIEKKIFNLQDANRAPVDATFIIRKNNKGEMGIHWKSQTTYPGYIETNKPTVVILNGGNQMVQQTTTTTSETETSGVKMNFGVPGGNISINTGGGNTPNTSQQTTTTIVSTPGSTNSALPCTGTLLSETDFAGALKSIQARTTADGKMLSAKQILSNNCMSVLQVKSILKIFESEESKLDLAKYAYNNTIDKGNYYKLNDVFANESSIDELNKAIIK